MDYYKPYMRRPPTEEEIDDARREEWENRQRRAGRDPYPEDQDDAGESEEDGNQRHEM